jgi:c(7)-type cytochrome triheme protein
MAKKVWVIVLACLAFAGLAFARQAPVPENYGRVIIKNFSRKAGLAPVVFDHWLHRSMFTCRLCHVDIGFAMEGGATKISAALNMEGYYCGACHDGKRQVNNKQIFAACAQTPAGQDAKRCNRCHSKDKKGAREIEFKAFTEKLPRLPRGDAIDWEKGEDSHLIKPIDILEGISVKRRKMQTQDDFAIASKASWAGDIIFSHAKHVIWNGCELCHPEIFPSTKQGTVNYSMLEIDMGQYCGACHTKVSFSLYFCEKCHVKPVQ